MMTLATLTMNPTIDVACTVERVVPTDKLRGANECHDPGGGGINVARVFVRLGGNARCYYLSGGATGIALDGLLDRHQLVRSRTAIAGETRVSTTVHERSSGLEYRFVPGGPEIAEHEWRAVLDDLAEAKCQYLVASGSLPTGVPADFYARVAGIARTRDIRFVLDTSGAALAEGIDGGGVFLAKPNLVEFAALAGREFADLADLSAAAMEVVDRGLVHYLAITMGEEGALLASRAGALHLPAIGVDACSTVGAGDSFVAAMVHALALGRDPQDAFRFGMAAGAAAVLTPGTDLCRAEDIARLYNAPSVQD